MEGAGLGALGYNGREKYVRVDVVHGPPRVRGKSSGGVLRHLTPIEVVPHVDFEVRGPASKPGRLAHLTLGSVVAEGLPRSGPYDSYSSSGRPSGSAKKVNRLPVCSSTRTGSTTDDPVSPEIRDRLVDVGDLERQVPQPARLGIARPRRRVGEAEQLDLRPVRQPQVELVRVPSPGDGPRGRPPGRGPRRRTASTARSPSR